MARKGKLLSYRMTVLCLLLALFWSAGVICAQEVKLDTIIFVQSPSTPEGDPFHTHMDRAGGSRIVSLSPLEITGNLEVLTEDFISAMDPCLSFDGRKLLFSAVREGVSGWNIWEMNVNGTGARQITDLPNGEAIDPLYLPDGHIFFCYAPPGSRDEYDKRFTHQPHRLDPTALELPAGPDDVERLTFNQSSDFDPVLLSDGRILFATWQHHGTHIGEAGIFSVATMNPDGTGFWPIYGNHGGGHGKVQLRETPWNGRVVFVENPRGDYGGGSLATFLINKPFTGSYKRISRGIVPRQANKAGRFRSPFPLSDGRMLVAFSPGIVGYGVNPGDPREAPHFGIYWFDFKSGRPGKMIWDDPAYQEHQIIPVVPQKVPPVIPSIVDKKKETGTLACLNVYLTDRPVSPASQDRPEEEMPPAKWVRIIEGLEEKEPDGMRFRGGGPKALLGSFSTSSNSGSTFEQKRIVGYAPVEEDGSFNVEVPADTILHLQILDENRMALQTQLTWIWVRPGENRTCIGCHEDRDTGAINAKPAATLRPASVVEGIEKENRRTVDFRRDLMPIIDAKCATSKCHDSATAGGGLDLSGGLDLVFNRHLYKAAMFNKAYENLLQEKLGQSKHIGGKLVLPSMARKSPLIWRLYEEQLGPQTVGEPYILREDTVMHDNILTEKERMLFVEWIDLGCQWDNIQGPDEYVGYNSVLSANMQREIEAKLRNPIEDPVEAFNTRCTECHTLERIQKASKTPEQWRISLLDMIKKRADWIPQEEAPILTKYLAKRFPKKAEEEGETEAEK